MRLLGALFVWGVLGGACSAPGEADADTSPSGDVAADVNLDDTASRDADVETDEPDTTATDVSDLVDAADTADVAIDTADVDDTDTTVACTEAPCPIEIDGFPYVDTRSTADATAASRLDAYDCAADTDESGPEHVYVFETDAPGTVIVGVESTGGSDIDVHILSAPSPDACLARGHIGASAHVEPGTWYVSADSWVDANGEAQAGDYTIHVHFLPDDGPCGMRHGAIPRIGTTDLLAMPATGPIVKEAHLVTAEEKDSFASGWPTAIDDGIAAHYAASEAASGYAMARTEPWAPCCEPSNEFGQGSSVPPPLEAEAWYVNMRWKQAPGRGERYLVFDPISGRAVVGAAGYENGPGDLSRVGGAAEEIHHHLGSTHLTHLTFGQAVDQALAYGPIDCTP